MRRSHHLRSSRTRVASFLAVLLPSALLALAQIAAAATEPVPAPGPPVVPLGAPVGTPFGVLLSGALLGAVCVAVATLLVASAAGRQQVGAEVTSGPVRPVVDPMLPADALGRSGTTLPGADQDKETRPRSAA